MHGSGNTRVRNGESTPRPVIPVVLSNTRCSVGRNGSRNESPRLAGAMHEVRIHGALGKVRHSWSRLVMEEIHSWTMREMQTARLPRHRTATEAGGRETISLADGILSVKSPARGKRVGNVSLSITGAAKTLPVDRS